MSDKKASDLEKSLILTKISKLNRYLGFLKQLRDVSFEELKDDFKTIGAVERYLQVSIESIIDIGNEIISQLQLRRPEKYRDIPYILSEENIIPREFADTIASMIGFRNILVHDYASIDLNLVYAFLKNKLEDFNLFIKYVAKWLEG